MAPGWLETSGICLCGGLKRILVLGVSVYIKGVLLFRFFFFFFFYSNIYTHIRMGAGVASMLSICGLVRGF